MISTEAVMQIHYITSYIKLFMTLHFIILGDNMQFIKTYT